MNQQSDMPGNTKSSIEERLVALEGNVDKIKNKAKDLWDKLQAISGILVAVAAIVAANWITNSLEVRRVEIASGKATSELLLLLRDSSIDIDKAEAAGISLAAYGEAAIVPLINELQSNIVNHRIAAEAGLRAIAVSHKEKTCPLLIEVLKNRTRLFSWTTHGSAIRLLGVMNCKDAKSVLESYYHQLKLTANNVDKEDEEIKVLKFYKSIVSETPSPSKENLDELRRDIDNSLKLFVQASQKEWRTR